MVLLILSQTCSFAVVLLAALPLVEIDGGAGAVTLFPVVGGAGGAGGGGGVGGDVEGTANKEKHPIIPYMVLLTIALLNFQKGSRAYSIFNVS